MYQLNSYMQRFRVKNAKMKYLISIEKCYVSLFEKLSLLEKNFKTEQRRTILSPEAALLMLPSVFIWVSLDVHRGLVLTVIPSERSMI